MKSELRLMRVGFVIAAVLNVVLLVLLLANRGKSPLALKDSEYVVSTSPTRIAAADLYREARVQHALGFHITSARIALDEHGAFDVVWSVPRKSKPLRH
jgi:hypothetical protein